MFLAPGSWIYSKDLGGLAGDNRGDNGRPHGDPLYVTRSRKPRLQRQAFHGCRSSADANCAVVIKGRS